MVFGCLLGYVLDLDVQLLGLDGYLFVGFEGDAGWDRGGEGFWGRGGLAGREGEGDGGGWREGGRGVRRGGERSSATRHLKTNTSGWVKNQCCK